jgi:peptidoglycan/LPS O-acetylase OafA/YrhL
MLQPSYVPELWPLSLFEEGHTGVALFMTLSGFIFYSLARRSRIAYGEFIRNRLLRIAPLFLLWTLLLFHRDGGDPVKLFVSVAGLLNQGAVPGVGWSIIVEFQFYVAFPFLLAFTQRQGPSYLVRLLLVAIGLRALMWCLHDTVQPLAYWTIFGRVDQFLLGMLASELYHRRRSWLAHPLVLISLVGAWTALYHRFNVLGGYSNFGGVEPTHSSVWIYLPTGEGLFYGLITASYLSQRWTLPAWLDRALAWTGTLSFSIYLNHMLVIDVTYKLMKRMQWVPAYTAEGAFAFGLFACLLTVLASAATYNVIERPFLALRRSYLLPLPD